MQQVWDGVAAAEGIATAGSGALNAAFFARHAWQARGPRRHAALLLTTLFAASVLASVPAEPASAASVITRAPLLAANLAASALLWAGAGR